MTDLIKAFGDGFNKVCKEAGREVDRIGKRMEKNIKGDADEIAKATKKDGLLGAGCATFDVLSPGHLTAELVDDFGPSFVHDHQTKQAIAGAVNITAGLFCGPLGIPMLIDGFAEVGDAMKGPGPGSKRGQVPTPAQQMASYNDVQQNPGASRSGGTQTSGSTHASSGESRKDELKHGKERAIAIEAAKRKSHDKSVYERGYHDGVRDADHMITITDGRDIRGGRPQPYLPGGGWATGGYGDNGVTIIVVNNDNAGNLGDIVNGAFGPEKIGAAHNKLKDILNDPSLSFEDKIFFLMLELQKEGQDDINGLNADLTAQEDTNKAQVDLKNKNIDKLQKQLDAEVAKSPPNQNTINSLNGQLSEARRDRDTFQNDAANSRQETVAKIKNALDKLTEMQQTLSNVLNSMHENAMNTIRNIK